MDVKMMRPSSSYDVTIPCSKLDDKKPDNKSPSYFRFNVTVMEGFSKVIAEVIGTALLMFGGCMGCVAWNNQALSFGGAISFGMTVMILVQCYGHISGAHFNPAVTLAAVIFRLLSIPMAIVYVFAQYIGATIGYRLLQLLTPVNVLNASSGTSGFCVTAPHEDLTGFQTFLLEYIATMVLISLCCAVWDPQNASKQDSIPIKFGLAVFALSFTVGPYTGCSMNPARTFAPALWTQSYTMHWIYMAAPMLSALCTAVGYKVLFMEKAESDLEVIQPLQQHDMPKV